MTFMRVVKTTIGYQVVEDGEEINFRGVIQPFTTRELMIRPESEQSWTWWTLHADPSLTLDTDEVVLYLGKQTRVMGRRDYSLNGYVEYQLVQDYTGAGPEVVP